MAEEEQVPMAGGQALSSKIPPWHLIPRVALDALANILALGLEKKKEKSWHAGSTNQPVLDNLDFLIERCGHISRHASTYCEALIALRNMRKDPLTTELELAQATQVLCDSTDPGAIMFGGTLLACAADRLKQLSE